MKLDQHVEKRVSFVARSHGDRLVDAFLDDPSGFEFSQSDRTQILQACLGGLLRADPTANKAYLPWIARQYVGRQFLMEDHEEVRRALLLYRNNKRAFSAGGEPLNLTSCDWVKFRDYVLGSEDQLELELPEVKNADIVTLHEGPLGTLAIPLTVEAAQHLGSGTKWCTSARGAGNRFLDYHSEDTPLYVWRGTGGLKVQVYFSDKSIQMKNAQDTDLSEDEREMFFSIAPIKSLIHKLYLKHVAVSLHPGAYLHRLFSAQFASLRHPPLTSLLQRDPMHQAVIASRGKYLPTTAALDVIAESTNAVVYFLTNAKLSEADTETVVRNLLLRDLSIASISHADEIMSYAELYDVRLRQSVYESVRKICVTNYVQAMDRIGLSISVEDVIDSAETPRGARFLTTTERGREILRQHIHALEADSRAAVAVTRLLVAELIAGSISASDAASRLRTVTLSSDPLPDSADAVIRGLLATASIFAEADFLEVFDSALRDKALTRDVGMVPPAGFEPASFGLEDRCSSIELRGP